MQRNQMPHGRYWIGSPDLILDTGEADPIDEIFYKSGLQVAARIREELIGVGQSESARKIVEQLQDITTTT